MARQRRFAFVERTTTGAERLMLANFDGSFGFSGPTARIITHLCSGAGRSLGPAVLRSPLGSGLRRSTGGGSPPYRHPELVSG